MYILGATATADATFGEGTGLVYFERIECLGREDSLDNCSNPGLEVHSCSHSEDAGVICQCKFQIDCQ